MFLFSIANPNPFFKSFNGTILFIYLFIYFEERMEQNNV